MFRDLGDVEWKEFKVSKIVETINIAKSKDFGKLTFGDTVFVGRQETNNGVQGFVSVQACEKRDCITISMVGNSRAFWQQYKFATSQNILILRNSKFNKYNAKFICSVLNEKVLRKFNYGKPVKITTFPNDIIMLPVNSKGEPDYEFMEKYIKEREEKLKNQYKEYISGLVEKLYKEACIDKEWQDFYISKIFDIKSGKRLTKANMQIGIIPFVGATDSNNGITNFVSNENSSTDKEVLGVNYNGSVVETFYHPYKCTFSDDVKRFSTKEVKGNKYIYLFLKNAILKQKCKYMYGYKFNENRMVKQKIMLPVNSKGEPDYKYMEDYMKYLEQKKLLEYLEYIK